MAPVTREETRNSNLALRDKLTSSNPHEKRAALDAVGDYTRYKVREDGVARRIIPPVTITESDLQRSITSPRPVVIVDREPDSPAAVSSGFLNLPDSYFMRGERYEVTISRLMTPRYVTDVADLATWTMDLRQVLSDNAIKEMLALEDTGFFGMTNDVMISNGATVALSGISQWRSIPGGISRDSLIDGKKVLPSTPSNIPAKKGVINHLTVMDVEKWGRDEMGGNLSEDIVRQGFSLENFLNMEWVVTIKRSLVPNNTVFYYGDPAFTGKFYEYVPPTMAIDHRFFLLEFFTYEEIGMAIGNTNAVARVDFE